jgi:HAD superfamily hydrolase (TIGR01509 family)
VEEVPGDENERREDEQSPEDPPNHAATLAALVVRAVLFDWNNTLVQFTWDDELLADGHRAGLIAIGRDDEPTAFTRRHRDRVVERGRPDESYESLLRELLGEVSDEDVDAFIDAEHDAWAPAYQVLGSAQAMLESLRSRGIKTGLVVNSWPDPGRVLRRDIDRAGLTDLLDVIVISSEVGMSKPEPGIFRLALDRLGVDPLDAVFVGDRLETDVQGAANLGMTTIQALWFRADDTPSIEPDFMAFTPMDVVNAVRRLAR